MARRVYVLIAWATVAWVLGQTLRETRSAASDDLTANNAAQAVFSETDFHGGLIVHLGCADGRLTAALGAAENSVVHGLALDDTQLATARTHIESRGIYGRVSVDRLEGERLPYADNLVKLLLVETPGDVSMHELMRVVSPEGVVLVRDGSGWRKQIKPRPADIDEWTHYLHDSSGNAVAADQQVSPPKHVRWIADPFWSRSHELNPSLNALVIGGGRMFYMLDEAMLGLTDLRFPDRWSLCCRDAFSGVLLWKLPVPNWSWRQWNTRGMWSAPLTLNRRVVTDGQRVFVTLGYNAPVTVLEAPTGRVLRTIAETHGTDEMILCDGVLLSCVREQLSVATGPGKDTKARLNPNEWTIGPPGPAAIMAHEAESGRLLWKSEPQPVTVLTLAALNGRACFQSEEKLICLDLKSGGPKWTAECRSMGGSRHSGGTLVLRDDVVLFTARDGLAAFSAENGTRLWIGPKAQGPGITHPPDLFVAGGLVWGGDTQGMGGRERTAVVRAGYDLKSGEVRKTVEVGNLFSPLHHVRCYRSKATDRFLLLTKRGVEFLDLNSDEHMRNDWLRAMCHYGFVPCNGLLYVPPHHCFCYPGVKMTGFLALAGRSLPAKEMKDTTSPGSRLQRGPAFGKVSSPSTASGQHDAWPTYRHDAQRSGSTKTPVPVQLKTAWQASLGGKLTQPVIAEGHVFVAQVDAHRVVCLDAATGERVWSVTAGGRVDSPPTIYEGMLLFGSRDGWVYCLRAMDGQLVWRFRAAPDDRRVVAFEQVESAWPVPGSVLVLDGVAYVASGRSSFLDGGVYLYGLQPQTGERLCETRIDGPWPNVQTDVGRPFDMDGVKNDILVTDGEQLYLFQMAFDKQLKDVTPPRASTLGDRIVGRHLMATGGFLQDFWYDRTYWTHSNRWPGFYYANDAPKAGQILVFDDSTTYGLHVFTQRLRLSPTFTPGQGYELFADDNGNEPVLAENSIDREKGPGFTRASPPKWSQPIRLRVLSMVLAGGNLFLAGTPDGVPENDPYAGFEGRQGAQLWVVSASDGSKLAEYPLPNVPAFDGMSSAGGKAFISMTDGKVLAFAGE